MSQKTKTKNVTRSKSRLEPLKRSAVKTPQKLEVWQLRKLGYTIATVHQMTGVPTSTIKRWTREMEGEYDSQPTIQAGRDTLNGLIGQAVQTIRSALTARDLRNKPTKIAVQAAEFVLYSTRVALKESTLNLNDERDRSRSTESLVEELLDLVEGNRGQGRSDNS